MDRTRGYPSRRLLFYSIREWQQLLLLFLRQLSGTLVPPYAGPFLFMAWTEHPRDTTGPETSALPLRPRFNAGMEENRTISQLEAEGYPWIGCECCKGTVG